MVQRRVLDTARGQFLFRVTPAARTYLLKEGTDLKYGARHLKRAIERYVVFPLANLLATAQVRLGDMLCIDWDKSQDRLTFIREGENLAMPARRLEPAVAPKPVQARTGKNVEAPVTSPVPEPTPRTAR